MVPENVRSHIGTDSGMKFPGIIVEIFKSGCVFSLYFMLWFY